MLRYMRVTDHWNQGREATNVLDKIGLALGRVKVQYPQ